MDRQIRSGQVLFDPAAEGPSTCGLCEAGYTLRVYTASNANAVASGGLGRATCVLWRVRSATPYALESATWDPTSAAVLTPWRVVATGIVNAASSIRQPAFTLGSGSRTLDVTFYVNEDLANRSTQTTSVQDSLTGRNTAAGTPITICATVPSSLQTT